ncbi:UDP-N-acetylenolpyruvoylglucosamine reductase [Halorhodospira abdelmalekii]|uniref:UDP-N-acetylmuramate dehydrogenase n=1 Tax=Halorhodospira abdelmalekii TaxID=421629 RepID=UPI00190554A5|nr:UDP-N-acetylmuramate dehydrogenase [Halorhodospira abdelmalekii]MBK1736089.1 UDP-N-acetylenolpyruvoylglucosamine reductase [Halorhodospira abdelmalekii]
MDENVPLKNKCTYHIGGEARYFATPGSLDELEQLLDDCKKSETPWFLLGAGSNVLFSDDGFSGVVIRLAGAFKEIVFDDAAERVVAGGAARLPYLSRTCAKRGIGGFEFLCDIPGTVGAAVRINAGTREHEIKDRLLSVKVLDPEEGVRTLTAEELQLGYRRSMLLERRWIVLEAHFSYGCRASRAALLEAMAAERRARKAKQPANPRNCGSVFKGAERPAGWYIEQCGLKGCRIGGAMIAEEHANWIVNVGDATAADVKALIELAQSSVYERFGVMLQREVEYVDVGASRETPRSAG